MGVGWMDCSLGTVEAKAVLIKSKITDWEEPVCPKWSTADERM